MPQVPFFQVDAFTDVAFAGNPAAVVILRDYPPDQDLLAIAGENNLAETAFLVVREGAYHLRWFTPVLEVPLCGHATLATAAVVFERLTPHGGAIVFETLSGALPVRREGSAYVLDFPGRPSTEIEPSATLAEALGTRPIAVFQNSFNIMAVLESEEAVRECAPDFGAIAKLDRPGVIITGRGTQEWDFVSRYFAPQKGVPEDPVTGAAHCMLAPYWTSVLGKTNFRAFQASKRGGEVICRLKGDRVELEGKCVFVIEGHMSVGRESRILEDK